MMVFKELGSNGVQSRHSYWKMLIKEGRADKPAWHPLPKDK